MNIIELPVDNNKNDNDPIDWERVVHNTTRWSCICHGSGLVVTKSRYVYKCLCSKGMERIERFPRWPENVQKIYPDRTSKKSMAK